MLETAGQRSIILLKSRTFWYIVIAIMAIIIIWRQSDKFLTKAESRLGKQTGDWQEGTISAGRKKQLEDLAQNLYKSIYSWGFDPALKISYMKQTAILNDNELLFLARHYENQLSEDGNSLWYDVDEEWLLGTSADEDLMARLSQIGMK